MMRRKTPNLTRVLEALGFLNDSVFVAHNVKFDYNFISKSLYECGFGILLNRKLHDRFRTMLHPKLTLQTRRFKRNLKIESIHHRALNDALAAAEILNTA